MKLKDFRQKYNGLLQKFIRLFSLSSVAFVLTACYGCPYAEYDVEGRVYDENGNPLEDMQVVVRTYDSSWDYPDTLYTNEDGCYRVVHGITSQGGDCIEVIVNDTAGDINAALFHLVYDNRSQWHQYICQNICSYDIIFFISYFIYLSKIPTIFCGYFKIFICVKIF